MARRKVRLIVDLLETENLLKSIWDNSSGKGSMGQHAIVVTPAPVDSECGSRQVTCHLWIGNGYRVDVGAEMSRSVARPI